MIHHSSAINTSRKKKKHAARERRYYAVIQNSAERAVEMQYTTHKLDNKFEIGKEGE